MKAQVNEIKEKLQQFNESEMFYKIPMIRTRYTCGLRYLANVADCYWLLTDVSIIAKCLTDRSYFIIVHFKMLSKEMQDFTGYDAEITYSDRSGNVFQTHHYHVNDFPLDELQLFFTDGTLMLPSEY